MIPTGTVTFLFTDIEGSTRMWDLHREQMQEALKRHDAIMRAHIESNGGYVFKTVGDAFCASFPSAPVALSAALAIRSALADARASAAASGGQIVLSSAVRELQADQVPCEVLFS